MSLCVKLKQTDLTVATRNTICCSAGKRSRLSSPSNFSDFLVLLVSRHVGTDGLL